MLSAITGRALGFIVGKLSPNWLVRSLARRFIAGRDIYSALGVAERLNKAGSSVSLDYIGEEVTACKEIQAVKLEYLNLLGRMTGRNVRGDISLKLSHLGILHNAAPCCVFGCGEKVLGTILAYASAANIRVWVDAERLDWREDTWYIVSTYPKYHQWIGMRIQAYAADASKFLEEQIRKGWQGAIGVCKGAYREPQSRLVQGEALRKNFITLCEIAIRHNLPLQIDTHDEELAAEAESAIGDAPHEHGLLLGVNEPFLRFLRDTEERVNIYLPYGRDIKGYIARRVAERPEYILLPFQRHNRRP